LCISCVLTTFNKDDDDDDDDDVCIVVRCSVSRYGNRCQWLKDDKFLKVLEGDSVDTDILDEELRRLQDEEPKTCVPSLSDSEDIFGIDLSSVDRAQFSC